MDRNSYFGIARDDLRWLEGSLQFNFGPPFNRQAFDCEQIAEEVLKGLVEQVDSINPREMQAYLKTHNLRKLGEAVNEHYSLELSLSNLAYLKDFCFNTEYPGNDFVIVDAAMRNRCLDILWSVLKSVKPFLPNDFFENDLYEMKVF